MPDALTSVPRRTMSDIIRATDSHAPDQISFLTGLACTLEEDMARQEFGPETEVKAVLARHGGSLQPPPPMAYGSTIDFSFGLTEAVQVVQQARESYSAAPADIREAFPTLEAFVEGLQRGDIVLKRPEAPSGTPPAVSSPPEGAETPSQP